MASDLCRILGTFQPDLAHYRETVTSRGTKLNALARIIGNSAQLGKYPVFQAAFVTTEAPKDATPGLGHDFFDSMIVPEYATIFRPPAHIEKLLGIIKADPEMLRDAPQCRRIQRLWRLRQRMARIGPDRTPCPPQ